MSLEGFGYRIKELVLALRSHREPRQSGSRSDHMSKVGRYGVSCRCRMVNGPEGTKRGVRGSVHAVLSNLVMSFPSGESHCLGLGCLGGQA